MIAEKLATTEERFAYGDSELDADVLEAYRTVLAACHGGESVADAYTALSAAALRASRKVRTVE